MQYLQRPFSVIPQRIHPDKHYICSSQFSVDMAIVSRFLQFARTIAMDPTTATTIKDPTQLRINVSISVSLTKIITQQLGIIKDQVWGVKISRIHTLCDKCSANPLRAVYAKLMLNLVHQFPRNSHLGSRRPPRKERHTEE